MRAALIRDGVVENVIEVGDEYDPPPGYEVDELEDGEAVGVGWTRAAGAWSAPTPAEVPPPSPTTEDLLARLLAQEARVDALLLAGIEDGGGTLEDNLDDLLDLPDDGGSLDDLDDLLLPGGELADSGQSLDDLVNGK